MDQLGLATLCDPRFKKIAFRDPQRAAKAVLNLRSEMALNMEAAAKEPNPGPSKRKPTQGPQETEPIPGPSAPKQKKKAPLWDKREENTLWDILDTEIRHTQSTDTIEISVASEVSKYLRTPNQPRESDPLKWWRVTGQYLCPNVWTVARKYLCIPATSVPSERVFSQAGAIISQRRASLNDDTAADLIMIRGNASRLPRGAEDE